MIFTTPFWLWLLVPWGAVVVWVLVTRSEFATVSTTQFWDQNNQTQSARRGFKRPPTGFALLLLAMMLAILAAAGVTWGNPSIGRRFTLVVDRNIGSMTATQKDLGTIYDQVRAIAGDYAQFDLVTVPDRQIEDIAVLDSRVKLSQLKSTAIDTSASINQVVTSELARTGQSIYVLSAQSVVVKNPRLHKVHSKTEVQNVGIDKFTLTPGDKPQVLVKVWNGSDIKNAILQVDDQSQTIDLPAKGGWRDFVVDLKKLDVTVSAKLLVNDDVPADNIAYLARRGVWPKLIGLKGLPEGIERMIDVYSHKRPSGGEANKVYVVTSLSEVPVKSAALVVAPGTRAASGKIELSQSERLATDCNWDAILKRAKVEVAPSSPGWSEIIKIDGKAIIARRESPMRQVWVGIDSPDWPLRTDYVIFFTDVFDYLGGASRAYSSELAHDLEQKWSISNESLDKSGDKSLESAPGIYTTPEGLVAMNMAVFQPENPGDVTRPEITAQESKIAYNLTRPTMFAAMLFALAGAISLTRTRIRLA